jgi:hypothetical protein
VTSAVKALMCAGLLVLSTSSAHVRSAAAPVFSVGDTRTRQNRDTSYTVSIVKTEDGGTWSTGGIPSCAGCLSFYDKNLTLLNITKQDGSAVDGTQLGFVPLGADWKYYDFPLTIKKK